MTGRNLPPWADRCNLAAIEKLESLGILDPSQAEIDAMEAALGQGKAAHKRGKKKGHLRLALSANEAVFIQYQGETVRLEANCQNQRVHLHFLAPRNIEIYRRNQSQIKG